MGVAVFAAAFICYHKAGEMSSAWWIFFENDGNGYSFIGTDGSRGDGLQPHTSGSALTAGIHSGIAGGSFGGMGGGIQPKASPFPFTPRRSYKSAKPTRHHASHKEIPLPRLHRAHLRKGYLHHGAEAPLREHKNFLSFFHFPLAILKMLWYNSRVYGIICGFLPQSALFWRYHYAKRY
ncbi:MAG: hypothetical protein E7644_03890 [Ruminococcaceae bacterium]|nr:hypothetical protein [Oscillospiraceae bacterium]